MDNEVLRVRDYAIDGRLGPRDAWVQPGAYRNSSALAAVNSVFSLAVRFGTVLKVIERYRSVRRATGADPERDSFSDLIAAIDAQGGPVDASREVMFDCLHRVPNLRPPFLKTQVLYSAAGRMVAAGLDTAQELRDEDPKTVYAAWRGTGLKWVSCRYLLMRVGADGVKADRMIILVTAALELNRDSAQRAETLLSAAARELGVSASTLDHRAWLYQSGRLKPGG